jgi:hypothetical protein
MAEERGQIREGRFKRQGTGLRESARYELETSPAGRRLKARLLLRKDEWYEKEANKRENGERPGFTHKQEPTGVELLT